jgi:hypothetical protein
MDDAAPQWARRGHYVGTEVDGRWWRRYRRRGFFARGNGTYWADSEAFRFLRYLTRTPLAIPFPRVSAIETGTRHAGRWLMGVPIVKIVWEDDGRRLSSGFVVSRDPLEIENVVAELRSRIPRKL